MNPHKVIDAYLPTENFRLGADYAPRKPATHFAFTDDGGSLERASLRCVGLGECRKHDSGAMCPSYMATLEEQHSTRGRAHVLFEMLQGEVVTDGWQDDHVKRRSICASPARPASPSVRRTWTWRPIGLSSSRIITKRSLALCMRIFLAGWTSGRDWLRLSPGSSTFSGELPGRALL